MCFPVPSRLSISVRRVCASRPSREFAIAGEVVAKYFVESGRILKFLILFFKCFSVICLCALLDNDKYGEVCFAAHISGVFVDYVM